MGLPVVVLVLFIPFSPLSYFLFCSFSFLFPFFSLFFVLTVTISYTFYFYDPLPPSLSVSPSFPLSFFIHPGNSWAGLPLSKALHLLSQFLVPLLLTPQPLFRSPALLFSRFLSLPFSSSLLKNASQKLFESPPNFVTNCFVFFFSLPLSCSFSPLSFGPGEWKGGGYINNYRWAFAGTWAEGQRTESVVRLLPKFSPFFNGFYFNLFVFSSPIVPLSLSISLPHCPSLLEWPF